MTLLERTKTLFTGVAVVLLLASTTFAQPAYAKHAGTYHGSNLKSDFYFNWGYGKRAHHHSKNRHFFGKKKFGQHRYKYSRSYGHSKKGLFKKHRRSGFNRSRSFGRNGSFHRH